MRIPGSESIRRHVLQGSSRALNLAYTVISAANRRTLRRLAASAPATMAPRPEQVEARTLQITIPILQHVVEDVGGKKLDGASLARVERVLREGLEKGQFKNYGQAILINPHRVDDLIEDLGLTRAHKKAFLVEAVNHFLIPEAFNAANVRGIFGREFRQRGPAEALRQYIERLYSVLTRDGRTLDLTRVVNLDRVKSNDGSPSICWVPGVACHAKAFDLDDDSSPVLEQADRGAWNYLFDPRGLGKNKGEFDPLCFFDTLVSNDLPAAVEFIHDRPKQPKPVILVCHSMGGMVAEFMLVRHSFKLDTLLGKISELAGEPVFSTRGRSRAEIGAFLDRIDSRSGKGGTAKQLRALIADARGYLKLLNAVKGLVTLGSPKIFDKNHHPIFPVLLMLNILLPFFGSTDVPVDKGKWLTELFPPLASVLRPLINAANFDHPNDFLAHYVAKGTDTFPLGVGFQLLKSIYSGRGVSRMSKDKFNYTAHLDLIPTDIPIFHLGGDQDPLDPPFNMAFIARRFAEGSNIDFAGFPLYSHPVRQVRVLRPGTNPDSVTLTPGQNQVQGFVIEGVNHLDYLYGKTAEALVRPLLNRIIDLIWQTK